MQLNYSGKNQTYLFGVDRTNGVFLSVFDKESMPILNLSEFYPLVKRFNAENVEAAVKENIIPAEDLKAILETSIGEFSVFFEGIQCQEDEWHDGIVVPEAIQSYADKVINGVGEDESYGLQVKCLNDYFEFIKNFNNHEVLSFYEVEWLAENEVEVMYTIRNDLVKV